MSHEIIIGEDTMFTVREPAWHKLGKVLDKPLTTVEQVLHETNLDWTVSLRPMYYATGAARGKKYLEVPDRFVVVRDSDDKVLGQVSERYEVVQNIDAFRFLDNLLGGPLVCETGGSLKGGTRVWLMCRIPEHITVAGDDVMQYVFVSTSHDGKQAVISAPTNIRIVCMNTLTWAISDAQAGGRAYAVRHLGEPSMQLQEAREAMGLTVDYNKVFRKLGDRMGTKKVGEKKALAILEDLYDVKGVKGDRGVKHRKEIVQQIMGIAYGKDGLDATTGNAPGTAWSLANAIVERQDHLAPTKGGEDARATAVMTRSIDDPDRVKARGFEMVAEAVGISFN